MADDPTDGSEKDRNAPTVRELKGPSVPSDTVPDLIGVYVPPRPLPEALQHRTMDLKSVRLSDYVDSRRALTERRLVSPLEQPPPAETRRRGLWLVPVIAFAVGIWVWLFIRESTPSVVDDASKVESPPLVVTPAPIEPPAKSAELPSAKFPTVLPELPPVAAPEPKIEDKSSAPAPSKAQRSRDAEKKRKDPWLE